MITHLESLFLAGLDQFLVGVVLEEFLVASLGADGLTCASWILTCAHGRAALLRTLDG